MQNFSPAADEIPHLPSGYSYLITGEVKLNPQHPPFIKMLAALPLLFLNLEFDATDPNLSGPQANDPFDKTQGRPEQGRMDEWQFGRDFLFENNVDRLIFWGRIPMILLSVLLGWYVFKWGRDLFGYWAGVAGLFIYTFMPNIIAHSQLVTTDMGVTAFSFIALYYLWKFTTDGRGKNVVYSGLNLGLALGSKFSGVFLLLIFFILLLVYVWKRPPRSSGLLKVNSFLKIILPIFGLAFLVIWALYFFPSNPLFYWEDMNMVYADHNPNYFYYLNGNFSQDGWWYYFLWAFIIKTPIPFLIILFAAIFSQKKNSLNLLNKSFIFLPVILFLFITSWKAYNIGVRYILLIYPFLILFAGGYVSEKTRNYRTKIKIIPILIFVLAVWYIFSAVSVYPNYLAYFNELIGGPNNGYKYLDDSNIDWGQDLKRLAQYQNTNPDLQVVYTWNTFTGASKMYGIENILPLNLKEQWLANPSGKYAINVHALIRLKLASQKYENDRLNWRDLYQPVDRIGQSFFIYEFP